MASERSTQDTVRCNATILSLLINYGRYIVDKHEGPTMWLWVVLCQL